MAKNNGMPLKVRPTGLGSEIDKERQDYTVYIEKWAVGRIYDLRWFWSFSRHGPMMVSAFEEAKDCVGISGRLPSDCAGEGAVSAEMGSVEGLGEAGRGALEACRTNFE